MHFGLCILTSYCLISIHHMRWVSEWYMEWALISCSHHGMNQCGHCPRPQTLIRTQAAHSRDKLPSISIRFKYWTPLPKDQSNGSLHANTVLVSVFVFVTHLSLSLCLSVRLPGFSCCGCHFGAGVPHSLENVNKPRSNTRWRILGWSTEGTRNPLDNLTRDLSFQSNQCKLEGQDWMKNDS